jgi:hypothetical protein
MRVRIAVNFNRKLYLGAAEIDQEWSKPSLLAEFGISELPIA